MSGPHQAETGSARGEGAGQPCVLVVDDDAPVRRLVSRVLANRGFHAAEAGTAAEALAAVDQHDVDVVLLDSALPDRSGLEVLEELRSRSGTATLPVILLTGRAHPADRVAGLEAGASDYLVKPVDLSELVARVRAQARGQDAWRSQVADALHQRAALAGAIASIPEGCELEDMAHQIIELLVDLASVRSAALVQVGRAGDNRVLGGSHLHLHHFGVGHSLPIVDVQMMIELVRRDDKLLYPRTAVVASRAIAPRYQSLTGDVVVAALGPGEDPWGLMLLEVEPTMNGEDPLRLTGAAAADLIPVVERVLGPALARQAEHFRADELGAIISERAFTPHYQPIVELDTGRPAGYEALTRFHDGCRPDVRFAQALDAGLGTALERATLEAALVGAAELPSGCYVSANVSAALVIGGHVDDLLHLAGDRPLVLEVTEHEQIQDYDAVRVAVEAFGPGVRLSVDDAGSGWASLRHVFSLRPDYVKVDRGWVSDIHTDPARQALLLGITQFVELTGGCVVAEGIETRQELATLRRLGITMGQGYLLGVPAPAADLADGAPADLPPIPEVELGAPVRGPYRDAPPDPGSSGP